MPRGQTPVNQRRRLLAELRDARDSVNLTQKDVAEALDWSTSKLIRIENGSVGVSVTDLRALLHHYGIGDRDRVDGLVTMARASKQQSWWDKYRIHYGQQFMTFLGLEASALRIRQFQMLVVPGLLQIPEYTRTLVATGTSDEEVIAREVEVRTKRQELLGENGPEMYFILDESVLHRTIGGPEVMRGQLLRLKELATKPNVVLQILPYAVGVHRGMKGSFEVFELTDNVDDYAVLLEQPYKDTLLPDSSEETREYVNIFFELEKLARPATETAKIIDEVLERMGAGSMNRNDH